MTGLFRILFLLIHLLGNLGDSVSTYLCAKKYGTGSERNPIVRGLMELIGVLPAMILKFVLHVLLAFWLCASPYWWFNLIIGIPYVWVSIHNLKEYNKKEIQ